MVRDFLLCSHSSQKLSIIVLPFFFFFRGGGGRRGGKQQKLEAALPFWLRDVAV